MSKIFYIIIFTTTSICILFNSSCNTLETPTFVKVNDIDIISENDSIYIESDIMIYNPNWHTLVGSDMTYSVFLDSTHIGDGLFEERLLLPSQDSTVISTRFLLKNLNRESLISINDSSKLTVYCSIQLPIISLTYSFDYQIDLFNHLEKIVDHSLVKEDFEIKNINLKSISLTELILDFDIEVSNNSKLNYSLDSVRFKLYKSKKLQKLIGQTTLSNQFVVIPDSLNQFNVSMQLNSLMMASSLFFKTIDQDIYYYVNLTGVVVFNGIAVPIDLIKKVEIDLSTMKLKLGK
jgi:LEA14-like dessication related protein